MKAGHLRWAGALAAVTTVGATGFATVGASADDSAAAKKHKAATITAVSNGKNLEFQGPHKVTKGAKLQIVNATDPQKVGPHTFTLVKKKNLPTTKQEQKDCEKGKSDVCNDVIKALKADPDTGEVKKPIVDVGKQGWDRSFGKKGDTWFTQEENSDNERKVSAKAGKTLHYFCVVHPFMHGEIKVK
jgi:hypothetical protein